MIGVYILRDIMAIIYYPQGAKIEERNTISGSEVVEVLNVPSNVIIYFDTSGSINTASITTDFTASWAINALTASYVSSSSEFTDSASYLEPGANIYLSQSYIYSDINASAPSFVEGQLWWDKDNHTYTIDTIQSRLPIGQENYVKVLAGQNLPNGTVVYINGVDIDPDIPTNKLPLAWPALANGTGLSSSVVGICTQDFTIGQKGFVTTQGIVNDLNTFAFGDGDLVYLSSTNAGGFVADIPPDPYEKIVVGTILYSHPTIGRILTNITVLPPLNSPYVGMINVPTFTDNHNQTFTVGSAQANFCITPDGRGIIRTYTIPELTVSASIGLQQQYVLGIYNNDKPTYITSSTLSVVDDIQTIPVISYIYPFIGTSLNYLDWDSAGTLLANKQHLRIIELYGVQRATGLEIGTSGSYITSTAGSVWYGVKNVILDEINTFNTTSNPVALHYHSASVWNIQQLTDGQFINDRFDDGTNTGSAAYGSYIVNYVYRSIASTNRTHILLSKALPTLTDAQIFVPPDPPSYFDGFSVLIGRIIVQSGSYIPSSVDSLFNRALPLTITPQHNDLKNIQGGTASLNTNEYYHLTSASYAQIQQGSLDTASYLNPGATFYVVSGSDTTKSAYIEPYNIPVVPYNPPYKEGRMFYDKDYSNWVYYTDQNFKLHVGKETIWRCYNVTGGDLVTGTPVYISGSTNLIDPDVWPAIADGTNRYSDIVGVIRHTTPSGETGYILQSGVIHGLDMTGFNIAEPLYLSSTDIGKIVNVEPGYPFESVRIGNCKASGVNGSIIVSPVFKLPPVYAFSGITSNIVIDNPQNGTIIVSTGSVNLYNNPDGYGGVLGYPLLATTLSLITSSTNTLNPTNYVVATLSNSLATYEITTNTSYANGISIVRVATLDINYKGPGNWDIHEFDVGIIGLALANRINNKDISLYGYQKESGLTLYTTGSIGDFGITEGLIWYGPNSHVVPQFDTTTPSDLYLFHTTSSNGTSSWQQHNIYKYQIGYYDSGSGNGITSCAPLSWSVNYVYRLIGTADEVAIILSSAQYPTELEASNNATTPSDLPPTIKDIGMLVGRFIVQSGSYSPTIIESAFSNIFIPAVVTNHESLLGLQGGGSGGGHYHIGADDWTGTGNGLMVRQTNPTLNTPIFAASTPYHIPYWDTNHRLTLTGSVQVYNNQYVLINSGSPDPINPEALLVQQINTSSVNTIGAYANVDNFSQIYNQNLNGGISASTDIVATSDIGTQDTHYIDMGIASSGYNYSVWPWLKPLDGYLEIDGGDLWLVTLTSGKSIRFLMENTNEVGYIDITGIHITGSLIGTSSWAENAISSSKANSSSYALTASYSSNVPLTASWANTASITLLAISSLWASESFSASWASQSFSAESSSWTSQSLSAISASWASQSFSAISASWTSQSFSAESSSWTSQSFSATSASWTSQSFSATSASWASHSFSATSASWASHSFSATSASWSSQSFSATSASWASQSFSATSASWASQSVISVVSVSSSWTSQSFSATSASWASHSFSASYTTTSSYTLGIPTIKNGIIVGTAFSGSPKTSSITFTKPFVDNNYSVVVTGESSRTWTIQNKVSGSFQINSNNNTAFINNVFWQAMTTGEFYT